MKKLSINCLKMAILKPVLVILFLLIMIFIGGRTEAQNKPSGKQPALNFFEVRKQFNDYWKDRKITKGLGYKPFRRWEWFWEQRVGRDGAFPSNDVVVREWAKYTTSHTKAPVFGPEANWIPMGPFSTKSGYAGLGRINCIAFHPTNVNTFWVGSPSGGLWKTTDYGQSWTTNFDSSPVLGVSDMVIDPNNPLIMYIATGDGDGGSLHDINATPEGDTKSIGILKSVDGGVTWNPTGLSWKVADVGLIRRLIMNPTNSSMLYAATSDGIYQTIDAGVNWTKQVEGFFTEILFNPGDLSILYAATKEVDSTSGQIFRTTDGGTNWEQTSNFTYACRIKLSVTPQLASLVEAICTNHEGGLEGMYRSTDTGASFSKFFTVLPNCSNNLLNAYPDPQNHDEPCGGQGSYDLFYLINPSNSSERWLGGVNTWKSADAGQTWRLVNYWSSELPEFPTVHADKHWFAFHPLQPGTFLEGNDGGIYYSKNGGTSWTDITGGMQIGQIYRIGNSWTNPEIVIGGFQDNGSQVDSAGTWLAPDVIGGDGMQCLVDYVNPDIKYASYSEGVITRTTDPAWKNVVTISGNIPGKPKGAWVTPYIIHPKDPKILYAGYQNIYKSEDRGNTWLKISSFPAPDPASDTLLRTIEISASNPQVMYAGPQYSLYRTTDGWASQTEVNSGLPVDSCMITGIAIHPKNPDTLFVSMGGYKQGKKVYRSYDGGANWTNISGTLPNLPVNCIRYQDSANEALYIGTDVGVFFMNTSITDWMNFSKNLPNVVVTDLQIQYMKGKIRAATYGRGLWESDLYVSPGTFQVNAVDIPVTGGDVAGDGIFQPGQIATMTAKPETGWDFKGWYENGNLLSDSSTYELTVNDNHNLVGMFITSTGINDDLRSKINLFPNPTKGILEVNIRKEALHDLQKVMVVNMEGKAVYESNQAFLKEHFSIDITTHTQGSYIVSFYFKSGGRISYTVVVSR
ncbi:MAG: hypothetical protein M0Q38_02980 [Bacteroidales bacterium]|jgi:photosystem II stability/assembly factor-like uncharacterized protein|nr:hypothetical protein [Bacteroidales bacterium]